jgi:hypothetical protein
MTLGIITTFADIFMKYGWPGIIAIIVIVAIYFIFNYINKQQTKQTTTTINDGFKTLATEMSRTVTEQNKLLLNAFINQSDSNTKMIKDIMTDVVNNKSRIDSEEHTKSNNVRLNVSEHISSKVFDMLKTYNCDRAFILEFHNSKQNFSGLSFVWYDMTYEKFAKGLHTICSAFKDQEISSLIPIINDVNNGCGIMHYTVDELEELQDRSPVLYDRLRQERHIQECIILGLYSNTNIMIGLIILEYERTLMPIEVYNVKDLLSEAATISSLLDLNKEDK